MCGVGSRVVGEFLGPGKRQAASGADFAGENVGSSPASFVARPPHLQHAFDLAQPGHSDGLRDVEDDDRVWIDGCDFLDQLVLVVSGVAGQGEVGLAPAPGEDHCRLGGFGGGDGCVVVGLALLRRNPGQAHLCRIVGGIAGDGDADFVRTGGEVDGDAYVVESVGRWYQAVFAAEHGVAVDPAAHAVCSGGPLAIDEDVTCCAEQLQVDPVRAAGTDVERAVPGNLAVGR